jgi:hypothetical protein
MKPQLHRDTQTARQALLPRIDPMADEVGAEVDPTVHALVEDYLDRVCRPLIETHSYHVRCDLRQELGQHIRSLICAYEEMGESPVPAAEKALTKFGEADTVARQWKLPPATVRRKPMRRWFRQQWQGIAASMAMCSVAMAVCGGISLRSVGTQRAAVREQIVSTQALWDREVGNSELHRTWATQQQCTSCHRDTFVRPAVARFGTQERFWQLPRTR